MGSKQKMRAKRYKNIGELFLATEFTSLLEWPVGALAEELTKNNLAKVNNTDDGLFVELV